MVAEIPAGPAPCAGAGTVGRRRTMTMTPRLLGPVSPGSVSGGSAASPGAVGAA